MYSNEVDWGHHPVTYGIRMQSFHGFESHLHSARWSHSCDCSTGKCEAAREFQTQLPRGTLQFQYHNAAPAIIRWVNCSVQGAKGTRNPETNAPGNMCPQAFGQILLLIRISDILPQKIFIQQSYIMFLILIVNCLKFRIMHALFVTLCIVTVSHSVNVTYR